MRSFFFRCKNYLAYYLRGFLGKNKWRLCSCFGISIIGIIVGIFVILPIEVLPVSSNYLILIPIGEYSIFGVFFKQTLLQILIITLACAGVLHPYLRCLGWIAVFTVGYKFGAVMVVAVLESTMRGLIYVFIFTIPIYLCYILTMGIVICYINNFLETHGRYRRCSVTCRGQMKSFVGKIGCCCGLITCSSIIFMLIIPSIVKVFIIV